MKIGAVQQSLRGISLKVDSLERTRVNQKTLGEERLSIID